MIKYEIDENGFLTGNWATIGSYDKYIELETELPEINKNLKYENGRLIESTNPKETILLLKQELKSAKDWFNEQYSYKEQKYRRLISLNLLDDNGTDPQSELTSLYNEAEVKRKKFKKLKI